MATAVHTGRGSNGKDPWTLVAPGSGVATSSHWMAQRWMTYN